MRKLRLTPEDLRVDSFSTGGADARLGTVRGRDAGTEHTVCWGLCGGGGESDCEMSCGGMESVGCTHDAGDVRCISYAIQCPATQQPNGTCYHTCVDAQGYSVCGYQCW